MHAWPVLLAAPFAGSLLGVFVRRLPAGRPVVLARSACEHCGHVLGVRELVPLASYAAQRGRCRACGAPIAPFHPLIELAALGVAAWAASVDGADPPRLWAGCLLGWMLLALGLIDWRHLLLPDVLTLPLLLAGLAVTAWLSPGDAPAHALAAALGYLGLSCVAAAYRRLRGREGLGGGDAKLLAAAGAWLGPAGLPPVLVLGALAGVAVALLAALRGGRLHGGMAVPFGSCLGLAIWTVWLYG